MRKILPIIIILLTTTVNAQDPRSGFIEMLSDEAINVQCQIMSSGSASTYATIRTNEGLTISRQLGMQLSQEIVSAMLATDMFDFNTMLFKDLIPLPNLEYFVSTGVLQAFTLMQGPDFITGLDGINPDIEFQANMILEITQEQCVTELTNHRENDHGGEDPATPKLPETEVEKIRT